jgi:hypothetical protein
MIHKTMLLLGVVGVSTSVFAQGSADAMRRGLAYVDGRAMEWLSTPFSFVHSDDHTCTLSCHTTLSSVMARAEVPGFAEPPAMASIRARLADRIGRWADVAPYYDFNKEQSRVTESLTNAVAELLLARGGQRGPMLDQAVDNAFALQLAGGDWNWMDESLAPFENRQAHYWGAALMTYALGDTDDARVAKLKNYLKTQFSAQNLHAQAMAVRASGKVAGILTPAQIEGVRSQLLAKQQADGSWVLAGFGPFDVVKGSRHRPLAASGDGYATGVAVLTLLESGSAASDAPLAKAKAWLLAHQDPSGAWLMKSLNAPGSDFNNKIISDAATAYAVMALHRLDSSH